jgi:Domain of unknown function (DUF5925)/ATPase family associated with various cellular activities (AAA)
MPEEQKQFTIDFPLVLESYGLNLNNIAIQQAYKLGYVFCDSINIAPNKKLEDKDIPKGELLCSLNDGNIIAELYCDNTRFVLLQKSYSLLSDNSTAEDELGITTAFDDTDLYNEDLVTNQSPELVKSGEDNDPLNPKLTEFKVTSVCFYHKTQAEALAYKIQLLLNLQEIEIEESETRITFWYQTSRGPNSYDLSIKTPTWEEIKGNYNNKLRQDLDQLISYDLEASNGSIILFHGPAGTGKTWYIRTLIHAWKKICQVNYIIDPDNLFSKNSAEYLINMMCLPKATGKYSILIMEDSGEMIAADAKEVMGQAMSRMLNLSDGILGQGGKNIMLISTNEKLENLNEAASRPGRCFAKIHFDAFPHDEANLWLQEHNVDHKVEKAISLAELYELLGSKQIANKLHKRIGFNND